MWLHSLVLGFFGQGGEALGRAVESQVARGRLSAAHRGSWSRPGLVGLIAGEVGDLDVHVSFDVETERNRGLVSRRAGRPTGGGHDCGRGLPAGLLPKCSGIPDLQPVAGSPTVWVATTSPAQRISMLDESTSWRTSTFWPRQRGGTE